MVRRAVLPPGMEPGEKPHPGEVCAMTQKMPTDLEAFCATCPPAEDVTALLAKLGFHLDFHMDDQRDHKYELPPLAAQYHYKDAHGTEVIYLAGRAFPMNDDGVALPYHASPVSQ